MSLKISPPAAAFAKALRSLETGGLTYSDVLEEITQLLADGASPAELQEILRVRELIEPLSESAHREVLGLLNAAMAREKVREVPMDPAAPVTAPQSVAPVPVAPLASTPPAPPKTETDAGARAMGLAAELAAARTALESERNKSRETAKSLIETETRGLRDAVTERDARLAVVAEEHASVVAALEARALALAADLAAARNAVESVKRKAQETYESLTARIELAEAARLRTEEALRKAQRDAEVKQTESRSLRDSLAVREAELAALQREHEKIVPALEARANSGAQLEADLQAARGRMAELAAELSAAQSRTEGALRDSDKQQTESRSLRDSLAVRETELAALQRELAKTVQALDAHQRGGTQLEAELQAALERVTALTAELSAARSRTAEALRDSGNQQAELRLLRDSLAVRDAEIAALQQDYSATAQSLEASRQDNTEPQADLQPLVQPDLRGDLRADLRAEMQAATARAAPVPARAAKPGSSLRMLGLGAVVLAAVVVAWFFTHRVPAPATSPEPKSAAAPTSGTLPRDCPSCPAMTILPAGRFKQGSPTADGNAPAFEKPQHWVRIGRPFAMSTNPVTVDEFGQFVAATGRDMRGCDTYDGAWKHREDNNWQDPGFKQTGFHPVTCVSFNDAEAYAQWLSAKTGFRYRLPSASEWEYAAHAGGEAAFPWNPNGSGACAYANVADQSAARRYPGWKAFACDDGYVNTSPVGSFKSNSFGLNDVLGNVFQWTRDCWHADYRGAPIDGSARTDGNCAVRELRGGSWFSAPAFVRANYRNQFPADYRTSSAGIRLVRDVGQ